ncbi:MAG TPA: DUF2970 domain-containing protein [Chromatiales bacterium]|nr:DUF2970 domain-containing protein [Chromatiales bacterium]
MTGQPRTPSLWDVARSIFAALLGVQKRANYERDFQHGRPWQYIILGLVFVVIFILLIVGVVKLVLSLAGV